MPPSLYVNGQIVLPGQRWRYYGTIWIVVGVHKRYASVNGSESLSWTVDGFRPDAADYGVRRMSINQNYGHGWEYAMVDCAQCEKSIPDHDYLCKNCRAIQNHTRVPVEH